MDAPRGVELLEHDRTLVLPLARVGAVVLVQHEHRRREAVKGQLHHWIEVLALRRRPHHDHEMLSAKDEEVTQMGTSEDGKLAGCGVGPARQLREVRLALASAPEQEAIHVQDEQLLATRSDARVGRQLLLQHELLEHLGEIIARWSGRRRRRARR